MRSSSKTSTSRELGDDVLVRVHAASIHVGDWVLMGGKPFVMRMATGLRRPKYRIPGTDVAGTVEAVGANVTSFRPGDEVFGWVAGAFAEYARTTEAPRWRLRPLRCRSAAAHEPARLDPASREGP